MNKTIQQEVFLESGHVLSLLEHNGDSGTVLFYITDSTGVVAYLYRRELAEALYAATLAIYQADELKAVPSYPLIPKS